MPMKAPFVADPAIPAEADGRFDRDARRRAEHGAPVVGVLLLEKLQARHRDDGGGDACSAASLSAAATAISTSEPVASSVTSRSPSGSRRT